MFYAIVQFFAVAIAISSSVSFDFSELPKYNVF